MRVCVLCGGGGRQVERERERESFSPLFKKHKQNKQITHYNRGFHGEHRSTTSFSSGGVLGGGRIAAPPPPSSPLPLLHEGSLPSIDIYAVSSSSVDGLADLSYSCLPYLLLRPWECCGGGRFSDEESVSCEALVVVIVVVVVAVAALDLRQWAKRRVRGSASRQAGSDIVASQQSDEQEVKASKRSISG